MKPESNILAIDPFLRLCRLPYYTWAQIRKLKLDQRLPFVSFYTPGARPGEGGVAIVSVQKTRGMFLLLVGWTADIGKNTNKRGHYHASTPFKALTGRRIEILSRAGSANDTKRELRMAATVVRRAAALARWAKRDGDDEAFFAMNPCPMRSPHKRGVSYGALDWFESLHKAGV